MFDFNYIEPPAVEIVIATDATRNGISKSQGDVYVSLGAQSDVGPAYVGVAVSNADYLVGADYDLTAYVGVKTVLVNEVELDGRVSFTKLYGEWGGEDAAATVSVSASREFGPILARASVAYTPNDLYFSDSSTYVDAGLGYKFGKNEISANVGRFSTDAASWNTYNVGYTRDLTSRLALDIRYYDTDENFGGPFSERAVASLRVKF